MTNNKLIYNFKILSTERRLHKILTPIIAITGGIASGKSTVVQLLKNSGYNVLSADHLIKQIYTTVEVKKFIQLKKPQSCKNDSIDFKILRTETFNDPGFKLELEKLLYSKLPEVFWSNYEILQTQKYLFYEVPLLFEKKLQTFVDLVVLIHAKPQLQLERISLRDQSDIETNQKIIKAQLPFEDKKDFAHFILENNGNEDQLQLQVQELILKLNKIFETT